mmetsp:Transcript_85713/g.135359  ORF Transcript_85713/g.135359 Transcript_85713/m.135359 type:complete len:222 (-) Transcript_85713:177-842(-)
MAVMPLASRCVSLSLKTRVPFDWSQVRFSRSLSRHLICSLSCKLRGRFTMRSNSQCNTDATGSGRSLKLTHWKFSRGGDGSGSSIGSGSTSRVSSTLTSIQLSQCFLSSSAKDTCKRLPRCGVRYPSDFLSADCVDCSLTLPKLLRLRCAASKAPALPTGSTSSCDGKRARRTADAFSTTERKRATSELSFVGGSAAQGTPAIRRAESSSLQSACKVFSPE